MCAGGFPLGDREVHTLRHSVVSDQLLSPWVRKYDKKDTALGYDI